MLKIIAAALALLGATVGAQASTLRIDVVGTATARVSGDYRLDPVTGSSNGAWTYDVAELSALVPSVGARVPYLYDTTGSVVFQPGVGRQASVLSCSGLLSMLCSGAQTFVTADLAANSFEVVGFSLGVFLEATQTGLTYMTDTGPSFMLNGLFHGGTPGMTQVNLQFSDVTLVAAPLPAGALLMLTGLGALGVAHRRKARRT